MIVAPHAILRNTANWSWEGHQNSTPTDVDHLFLPSYGLLNMRIEYLTPDSHWTVALFGTNILNKLYYVGGVNYSSNVGSSQYSLGRPQEFGVTARYSF